MLKLIMRTFYHDDIYTNETELFYKFYKWDCGLFTLLQLRRFLCLSIFGAIGIAWLICITPRIYGLFFIGVSIVSGYLELIERQRIIKFGMCGARTPSHIRTLKMMDFIKKFISMNGKALGRTEWKAIKQHDIYLYNDLLCDECDHCCYFYSLEIARILKDSTLIWGAVKDPFESGHNYYAHAVILRNGYIYDSNMRQSESYEDFIKLYKFKLYKQWKYDEYSQDNFRENERTEFRKWCKESNVLCYENF